MDFMSKLKPKSEQKEGYSILLYGDYGTGKTSIIDDPEMNILYLDAEDSGMVLPKRQNLISPEEGINSWEDLEEALQFLEESAENRANFDIIAIDGLSRVMDYASDYAIRTTPQVKRWAKDVPAMQDWGHLLLIFKKLMKRFANLSKRPDNKKPLHVVFIGHSKEEKDEVTGIIEHKLQLSGKDTSNVLGALTDIVGFQTILLRKPKDAEESEEVKPERQHVLWLKRSQHQGKQFDAKIRVPKEIQHEAPPAMRDASVRRLIDMMDTLKDVEKGE